MRPWPERLPARVGRILTNSFLPFERLYQNVILRRSRRICFLVSCWKSRCFAFAQHDIQVFCNIATQCPIGKACHERSRRNIGRGDSFLKLTLVTLSALVIASSGFPEFASAKTVNFASNTPTDRKSTRLNSSHLVTSYAVFC